jgi:hypothetical protein
MERWRILMKSRYLVLLMVLLASLIAVASGCIDGNAQVSETSSTRSETFILGSGQVLLIDSLGLTDQQVQILKEQGVADVNLAEVASRIAGFNIATPAYVPEGFNAGTFIVQLSGVGLPEELKPKFNNTQVNQYFTRPGEKYPMFLVTQSPHKFGISGSEPAMICGRTVERSFSRVTLDDSVVHDRLVLAWDRDGVSFIIVAVLGEGLNETITANVACSLSTD